MKDDPSTAVHAENRRLTAIMFTDIVGFSRQMGANEARMLRLLEVHNRIVQQAVAEHHGTVIKTVGDAFLVDFPSVVHAVQCAQTIQAQFRAYNAEQESAEQIHVRIGIHLGDIVVQPTGDVLGDGVNIASRLQELAEPDTIYISHVVYQEVEKKLPLGTVVSLGQPKLKNITQRFPVYTLLPAPPQGVYQTLRVQRLKLSRRLGVTHRVAVVVVLVALVSGGAILLRERYFPSSLPLPLPDKPSMAVLPFTNLSGDPEQEYFSDGLTDDLITDLSKLSGLFVIARNSVFTYKGKAMKVEDVSRELGVRYVLEGSIRKAGDRVRINAQLVDALTGGPMWTERYDRELKDIFALQDEMTQRVVETLKIQVTLREQGALVQGRATESLEAYDAYLRGMERLWRYTKDANVQAWQMFERATELDSQYAVAYVWLGWTYWLDWSLSWNADPSSLGQAFALAQKAIALDDSLPLGYSLRSNIYLWQKQHEQAIAESEWAITLDPNYAQGYADLGWILTWAGRPEKAIEMIEKAMRLNPHYPFIYSYFLGQAYHVAGRYEEAIAALKGALSRNSHWMPAHRILIVIYSELGQDEEARAEAAEVLRLNPNFSLEVWKQTVPYKDQAVLERHLAALRKAGVK